MWDTLKMLKWFARLCLFLAIEKTLADLQLWEISGDPRTKTIASLKEEDLIDVWSGHRDKTQVLIESENVNRVKRSLHENDLHFEMLENDVLALVEEEQNYMQHKRKKRAADRMDWTSYHKLDDIEGHMGWLNATNHGVVSVIPVATTYKGRHVYVAKVSDPLTRNRKKKKIWIEGGIHAREWISPAVTTYLLHQVATSPEFRPLLAESDWYFVPVANPDGYEYSFSGKRARLWRKNRRRNGMFLPNRCQGVDLNRNWDLKWGVGASEKPCSDLYRGKQPFSESETEGLRRVMMRESPFDLFITFHSFGQSVLYPWGWTTNPPRNVADLNKLGRKFADGVERASRKKTRYKVAGSGEYYGLASGASDDWAYGEINTPYSYTIELRDTGRHGFLLPENQILDTVQESVAGVYCMVSYLTSTGQCSSRSFRHEPVEPRGFIPRDYNNNRLIFI